MASTIPQLNQVYDDLAAGKTAKPVTVRDFLSWFGAQRRTSLNVWYINNQLAKCRIQTVPNYLETWVDSPIAFELTASESADHDTEQPASETSSGSEEAETTQKTSSADPSFKIGKLEAATRTPISVKPNDSLEKAMTIMMSRNFSQLPVMTSDYNLKGAISWSTIGERHAMKSNGSEVQDFMTECHELSINSSVFRAIQVISEYDFVVVRDAQNKVSGIITANDIALQFEETSTPFLLLSEIENNLRLIIDKSLTTDDIKQTCKEEHLPKDFSKVSDLTLGNCVYIIDHSQNWEKIGLHLDKVTFVDELKDVNRIRNEVMHFDPDPLKGGDIKRLKDVARLLEMLRRVS